MFDSLNRRMLPSYGNDWVRAPNFERLAKRTVTFDTSYVGSMPCMPARRDLHTGRPNFFHRGWGPLEPWDDSVFEMLGGAGVYSHLATDHYHYFESGGANYHTKYTTYENFRGQEGDPWRGVVAAPEPVPGAIGQNAARDPWHRQDLRNRAAVASEADFPQVQTFDAGLRFIEENADADRWVLQIETFDPHEPSFSPESCRELYPDHHAGYEGPHFDWPAYVPAAEPDEVVDHLRHENAALVSLCDRQLGRVLDLMDERGMWDDTMLIVWTDHGFLLGEHESYGKCWTPFYEEVARTPFFVWDPRSGARGERRDALVQPAIDLAPTLLRYFGEEPTSDMLGCDLADTIATDAPVRETAVFGVFGGQVNVADGRYVYLRAPATPENLPLFQYTLNPTHMKHLMSPEELAGQTDLHPPFPFTKSCPVLRIAASDRIQTQPGSRFESLGTTRLYDLHADPAQRAEIEDPEVESRMCIALRSHLSANDAPSEQTERLGLG